MHSAEGMATQPRGKKVSWREQMTDELGDYDDKHFAWMNGGLKYDAERSVLLLIL